MKRRQPQEHVHMQVATVPLSDSVQVGFIAPIDGTPGRFVTVRFVGTTDEVIATVALTPDVAEDLATALAIQADVVREAMAEAQGAR